MRISHTKSVRKIFVFLTLLFSLNSYLFAADNIPKSYIDASGNIISIWQDNIGGNSVILASTFNATTTVWVDNIIISNDNHNGSNFDIVGNPSTGDAVVTWLDTDPETNDILLFSKMLPFSATWHTNLAISSFTQQPVNNYTLRRAEGTSHLVVSWSAAQSDSLNHFYTSYADLNATSWTTREVTQ